ncbi:50S ribosomal protein L9 [Anaerohalosphaera lusitana]|uniref:Large ribosomal subunit protein bL9 n=1 Tax=Anaerohalosphaera lusitana TaxID=1936003 RepID=A0A1U9NHC7_9BACT|nr:50S ribosomal protein L9 [Anaerohalosphaera lusitana]AQT67331.1 50S ribosomal protein L9 [Anaerohalosphaera lusitana]
MKILLTQDVENLGYLGDVVDVKDGYARNYLLPYGIATVPTEGNIKSLADEKAKRAEERRLVREQLERAAEKVEGAEAVIASKANEQGHLFGSVTERDIAENLREQGYEIADDMIKIDHHLKEVGGHDVEVKLAADLSAQIKVTVISLEQAEEAANAPAEEAETEEAETEE